MFSIQQQIHFSFTSKFTYIRIYILYLEFGVHIFVWLVWCMPGMGCVKGKEKQKELMPKTQWYFPVNCYNMKAQS